jgi:alpha-beta hydrolase superfamily lysophospholipase
MEVTLPNRYRRFLQERHWVPGTGQISIHDQDDGSREVTHVTSRLRRALFGGCGLVLAVAVVEGHYASGAASVFHPKRKAVTGDDKARAREALPGLEEVSFRTADGLLLRGFYAPSRNGASVVMGHGVGSNRMQLLDEAQILARHGYGSLMFDFRAHGESEGDLSTWGDREQGDFAAAVDFASARGDVTDRRIAALAFSMGGYALALEAAGDPRVRAVILEATYPEFDSEFRELMGRRGFVSLWPSLATARYYGIPVEGIRPIDHVAAIAPRPLLIVVGSNDPDAPLPQVRRLFDAAAEPKKLYIVKGAEHGGYARAAPEEYEHVLAGFLDAALFGAGTL